jgi:hypothetical protein
MIPQTVSGDGAAVDLVDRPATDAVAGPSRVVTTRSRTVTRGDLRITTTISKETVFLRVRFSDLVAACVVEEDDNDGVEAEARNDGGYSLTHYQAMDNDQARVYTHRRRGYIAGDEWHGYTIELDKEEQKREVRYFRDHVGCTRQTAGELAALCLRQRLDYLVDQYERGWPRWQVTCSYLGYTDNCGGIDGESFAYDMRAEVAGEVADQLEDAGFTVFGRPAQQHDRRAVQRSELKRKLHGDCWGAH